MKSASGRLSDAKANSAGTVCLPRRNLRMVNHRIKHGHTTHKSRSATYGTWMNMIQRCTNPKNTRYLDYGGRGITVCAEWLKFQNFLADMGEKPEGMTIDRINNADGYSAENCKWSSRTEQQNNTRRNHRIETSTGMLSISAAARVYRLDRRVLETRVRRGWPLPQALGLETREAKKKAKP